MACSEIFVATLLVILGVDGAGNDSQRGAPAPAEVENASAGPRRWTFDGYLKRDPVFWPGGEQLIYTRDTGEGRMRLYRLWLVDGKPEETKRVAGTIELFHADEKNLSDRELCVSADGSVYAYNVISGLSSKIVVRETATGKKRSVPLTGLANWSHWPTLSPDGRWIAFTEGAAPLLMYDLEKNAGKEGLRFVVPKNEVTSEQMARFTPDGKRLVFASRRGNDYEIWSIGVDGEDTRRLTESPGIDLRPSVSPSGEHVAFTSNRDGNYEIYVMRIDGSEVRRVTEHPERDDFATWSLDGRSLVIVCERDGLHDLWQWPVDVAGPPSEESDAVRRPARESRLPSSSATPPSR